MSGAKIKSKSRNDRKKGLSIGRGMFYNQGRRETENVESGENHENNRPRRGHELGVDARILPGYQPIHEGTSGRVPFGQDSPLLRGLCRGRDSAARGKMGGFGA